MYHMPWRKFTRSKLLLACGHKIPTILLIRWSANQQHLNRTIFYLKITCWYVLTTVSTFFCFTLAITVSVSAINKTLGLHFIAYAGNLISQYHTASIFNVFQSMQSAISPFRPLLWPLTSILKPEILIPGPNYVHYYFLGYTYFNDIKFKY